MTSTYGERSSAFGSICRCLRVNAKRIVASSASTKGEARLKRFAVELAKRGWIHDPNAPVPTSSSKKGRLVKLKLGSGPSSQGLQNQASATAIEDFLRLNFALLDVKKFQRVNVEAARKILKKHDKRTALTASNDLRTFMAQQEAARRAMGINPVGSGGVVTLPASAFQPPSICRVVHLLR